MANSRVDVRFPTMGGHQQAIQNVREAEGERGGLKRTPHRSRRTIKKVKIARTLAPVIAPVNKVVPAWREKVPPFTPPRPSERAGGET